MESKAKKFKWEPRKCHCGKPALYQVYRDGFCKEHYAEAVKAQAQNLKRQQIYAIARKLKNGRG